MTEMITITFGDASTLDLNVRDGTLRIQYMFGGLSVTRQPNKVGLTTDSNRNWREVECIAYMEAATIVDTLNGKLMPATAPTYDGTDPKILVNLSGAKSLTILCTVKSVEVSHTTQDKYDVKFVFEERSL